MASKTKYIGSGTTILTVTALILWMVLSPDFDIAISKDPLCDGNLEDPCIQFINATFNPQNTRYTTFYIRNKGDIKLDFSPDIIDYALCKKDGRYKKERSYDNLCGPGYREILTKPYYYKYLYYYKFYKGQTEEWMLVGLKKNPSDTVKWGIKVSDREVDPIWLPTETKLETIKECHIESHYEYEAEYGGDWTWDEKNKTWYNKTYFKSNNPIQVNETVCKVVYYKYNDEIFNASDWCCYGNVCGLKRDYDCNHINNEKRYSGHSYKILNTNSIKIDDSNLKKDYLDNKEDVSSINLNDYEIK